MITALDTDGRVWFALTHATTDSNITILFLRYLMQALDCEIPGWQEDSVIQWDNAPYHSSTETKNELKKLGLKVVYSGPYSFSAAPIETLFSGLKFGELNPENQATGKR